MDFDIRFKAVSSKRVRLHYHLYTGSFTLTHPKWLSKMKINEYVIAWEGWMLNCLREQPPPIFKEGCAVTLWQRADCAICIRANKRRVELSEGSVLLYEFLWKERGMSKSKWKRLNMNSVCASEAVDEALWNGVAAGYRSFHPKHAIAVGELFSGEKEDSFESLLNV